MVIQEGEYVIPEGCTVKRVGDRIVVYQRKNRKLEEGEYRCKDCAHCVKGHSMSSIYLTDVCNERSKRMYRGVQLCYAVLKYGKPCEKFKLRDDG